jgi:hypothetical protein
MPFALSLFREKRSIPKAPFIHSSKSLVDEHSSMFPRGAAMERDAHLQSLFYLSSRIPSKEAFPPRFPSQNSQRERKRERETPHLQNPFQPSLRVPSRQAHSRLLN